MASTPANEQVENENKTRFQTTNYGMHHSRRQIDQSIGDWDNEMSCSTQNDTIIHSVKLIFGCCIGNNVLPNKNKERGEKDMSWCDRRRS